MDSKPIYIKLVKVKNELKPRISSLIKYKLEPALTLKEVFHLFKIVKKENCLPWKTKWMGQPI